MIDYEALREACSRNHATTLTEKYFEKEIIPFISDCDFFDEDSDENWIEIFKSDPTAIFLPYSWYDLNQDCNLNSISSEEQTYIIRKIAFVSSLLMRGCIVDTADDAIKHMQAIMDWTANITNVIKEMEICG